MGQLVSLIHWADRVLFAGYLQPFHLLTNSVVKSQSQNHWTLCKPYMEKFLPLLGTTLDQTSTQYTASLVTNDLELEIMGITSKSRYVCAPNGVAGMGMVSTSVHLLATVSCFNLLVFVTYGSHSVPLLILPSAN